MLKLTFAVALLIGANAISTDAKDKLSAMRLGDRDLGDLSDISDIPLPSQEDQDRTLGYWANKPACQDLFTQLITIRKRINVDITEYRRIVTQYNTDCTISLQVLTHYFRRVLRSRLLCFPQATLLVRGCTSMHNQERMLCDQR